MKTHHIQGRGILRNLRERGISNGPMTAEEIAEGQRWKWWNIAGFFGEVWRVFLGVKP